MLKRVLGILLLLMATHASFAQLYRNEWIDYSKTYYKFKLGPAFGNDAFGDAKKKGLCRISQANLTAAGISTANAEYIQLWRNGEQIPVYTSVSAGPLTGTDYVEFWGEINDGKLDADLYRDPEFQLSDYWSLQTDTAHYFLTLNTNTAQNKRLVPTANNVSGNTLAATDYFNHSVQRSFRRRIQSGFSAVLGERLYSSSYDRGEGYMSKPLGIMGNTCDKEEEIPVFFGNLYPYLSGPGLTVRVNAVGNAQNSRTLKIMLNNDSIAGVQMDYMFDAKFEEGGFAASRISGGFANIVIRNNSSTNCDEAFVSKVELVYPRNFNFGGTTSFEFSLPASPVGHFIKIANFNYGGQPPVLMDITNGKRYVGDLSIPDSISFVLEGAATAYQLVLVNTSNFVNISGFETRNFVNFNQPANQGDYLIISNPLIYGSGGNNYVEQYRQYRASALGGNYNAKLISIHELVDQFAYGVKMHPLSVKNFLRFARANFSTAPKFAFLIGKAVTYNEYRGDEDHPLMDYLNLVPTWGNPASDNMLASEGLVAIPATPIGRLSAISPQEVGDYLQKVQQYEANQADSTQTIANKAWMKNVIQMTGANDLSLGAQLDGYINNYKQILSDTALGANVINYSKTANPGAYPAAVLDFKNKYENGASLIMYFGHSSATSLDFNLDDPQNYNNQNKYPIFIANGCSAGNHFTFETNRLNGKSTISEKFVLANQRGAIGYLASSHFGVVNYLDRYTQEFYKSFAQRKYGLSVGEAIKDAIATAVQNSGLSDFYARVHAEETAFHGDPAIKLNVRSLPDYVVEATTMSVAPTVITVSDDSFYVKTKVYNLGRSTADSVSFRLTRKYPDNSQEVVFTKNMAPISFLDSVIVALPIVANRDKGTTVLIAQVDYTDIRSEVKETNNSSFIQIDIIEDVIKPVFPYNFAIINNASQIKLQASTVNPFNTSRPYTVEVDTTELFNSSLKVSQVVNSAGGLVTFNPSITYQSGFTYYWRTAPTGSSNWSVASFKFDVAANPGMGQGHVYQHFKSNFSNITLDSSSRKFGYAPRTNNLFVTHSIYPTSGTEDGHFSIAVNGSQIIKSACLGNSIIFNVFDTLTFKPWRNVTGQDYGSGWANPICASNGREYNFEFNYTAPGGRNTAKNFFDIIPNGTYVAARLVYDGDNAWAAEWADDSTIYGSGNSLYYKLKQQGFAQIDSFYKARTFAFIFKKNDSANFTPVYRMSDGIYDRITLSANLISSDTLGYITSPAFGPARSWSRVKWGGSSADVNDKVTVKVIGVTSTGVENELYELSQSQQDVDISAVNAVTYPYIKLKIANQDSITASPYQLDFWKVEFNPVAEGAIAPNLYFTITDSVGYPGYAQNDTMRIGVAFKNVSTTAFDSLKLKLVLYDSITGAANEFVLPKTKPLAAGDTLHIDAAVNVATLHGRYNVYLMVNADNDQQEQRLFNNFLYRYVHLNGSITLPVTLTDFYAKLQYGRVALQWKVSNEQNFARYEVEHSINSINFTRFTTVQATNAGVITALYNAVHQQPVNGKNYYRLKLVNVDGSFTYSPVRMVQIGKGFTVNVYPNPVKDQLNVAISKADNNPSTVRIMNMYGQLLLQKQVANNSQIDVSQLTAGTYVIQIDAGEVKEVFKIQKQ
jgi:hypothetical protein